MPSGSSRRSEEKFSVFGTADSRFALPFLKTESLKTENFHIVGTAGWRLFEYPSAGSTNDLARDLPAWSAVRSDTQTGGRGRFGRVFVSDPGGLWISAVLPAEGSPQQWAGFSLMVGVHLVRMLEQMQVPGARLRWPNDLMAGPKKLGGLLIEQSTRKTLVVGFGLNVKNAPWDTDPALDAISTSLARVCGAAGKSDVPDVFEMAVRTLNALADAHQAMQEGGMSAAILELNARWATPVPVQLQLSDGGSLAGGFAGLDPLGNLRLLASSSGEILVPHQSVEKLIEIY